MGLLNSLFSVEELKKLDDTSLEVLRDAIMKEVRSNDQIRRILKSSLTPVYDQLRGK
jgi:hypothetical protein